MKHITIIITSLCLSSCLEQSVSYEKYVNPLIGTDIRIVKGKDNQSTEQRGQNMPAVGVPHGMTNWVAQTQATEQKCHPPYYYFQDAIQGFRASHWTNGSCTQDYGSFTIMPMSSKLEIDPQKRASYFSHEEEIATPSYYSVELKKYNIKAELTGLSRTGILQLNFRNEDEHFLVIEPNSDEGVAFINIDVKNREITGYNPVHRIYQGFGKEAGFSGHFIIKLDKDIADFGIWDSTSITIGKTTSQGKKYNVGAWVKLASKKPGKCLVKMGTSFTSIENARENMETEIPGWDFEQVHKKSSNIWNETLGKISVKGKNDEEKVKFYSALYNAHFLPRAMSDADGSYPKFDGGEEIMKMEKGTYYCDFSQWDTYRAVHPLFTLLNPSRNGEMANSLILKGQQGGWLPIFPAWNSYTAAMIGDHCTAMIGDAIMKDAPGFNYEEAYELMRKNAFEPNKDSTSYKDGKGRRAMESYIKYGYVPLEDDVKEAFHKQEQVSRTLEYAYDDFVLAEVAKKLGKTDDYNTLIKRAQNYRNVIDPETGFARGRHNNGDWVGPFEPYKFTKFICEGTPYHYTWYVPQDIAGLMEQMGGKQRFIERLDKFFSGNYYWHGNEPGHHIAYLFVYAGEPWKTQKWIHDIIRREYFITPDGLSGNDDAGQMSAWLVFSMVGFYPVCPGMPYYVIGSPTFEESKISLENGKKFIIEAKGVSEKNIYIQSATLNGKPYNKSYILHKDIMKGGKLSFVMGDTPNKEWATEESSIPPSLGKNI